MLHQILYDKLVQTALILDGRCDLAEIREFVRVWLQAAREGTTIGALLSRR
jgi:hypothetical protein